MAYVPAVQVPSPAFQATANFAYPAATSGSLLFSLFFSRLVVDYKSILVFVSVNGGGPVSVSSVTDALGNTYSLVKRLNGGTNGGCLELWLAENVTTNGSGFDITVTTTGSTSSFGWSFTAFALSNCGTSGIIDAVGSGFVGNGVDVFSDSIAASQAADLTMFFVSEARGGGAVTTEYQTSGVYPKGLLQGVSGGTVASDASYFAMYYPNPSVGVSNTFSLSNASAVSGYALAIAIKGTSQPYPPTFSSIVTQDAQGGGSSTGSVALTMAGITANDVLILYVASAANTTLSVTDNQGNTWTLLGSATRTFLGGYLKAYGLAAVITTHTTLIVTVGSSPSEPVIANCLRFNNTAGLPTKAATSADNHLAAGTGTWTFPSMTTELGPGNAKSTDVIITGAALISNASDTAGTMGDYGQGNQYLFKTFDTYTKNAPDMELSTYLSPGQSAQPTLNVGGTVGDNNGNGDGPSLELTQLSLLLVVDDPTIVASATPTTGVAPLTVVFSSLASGTNPPFSYSWTFGDGGTATGANPTYTYQNKGNYVATVTATDALGDTIAFPLAITVTSPAPSGGASRLPGRHVTFG